MISNLQDQALEELDGPVIQRPMESSRWIFCFILIPGLFLLLASATWTINEISLNHPLHAVIDNDVRNSGIKISAHYDHWLRPSTLVIDIRGLEPGASRMDVFRAFLQYADKLKARHFHQVILSCRRTQKYILDGDYFNKLGQEYSYQNPIYTMRNFPLHLETPEGAYPYHPIGGGFISAFGEEIGQFTDSQNSWYWSDVTQDLQ